MPRHISVPSRSLLHRHPSIRKTRPAKLCRRRRAKFPQPRRVPLLACPAVFLPVSLFAPADKPPVSPFWRRTVNGTGPLTRSGHLCGACHAVLPAGQLHEPMLCAGLPTPHRRDRQVSRNRLEAKADRLERVGCASNLVGKLIPPRPFLANPIKLCAGLRRTTRTQPPSSHLTEYQSVPAWAGV